MGSTASRSHRLIPLWQHSKGLIGLPKKWSCFLVVRLLTLLSFVPTPYLQALDTQDCIISGTPSGLLYNIRTKIKVKCDRFGVQRVDSCPNQERSLFFQIDHEAITLPLLRESNSLAKFISVEPCIQAKPA